MRPIYLFISCFLTSLFPVAAADLADDVLELVEPARISQLTLLNGSSVAWLERRDGRILLRRGPLPALEESETLARFDEALVRGLHRVAGGLVLHLANGTGEETLWWVGEADDGPRRLGAWHPASGLRVLGPGRSGRLLVSHDERRSWEPDLWSVSLENGSARLEERNPGRIVSWLADRDGAVRLAQRWSPAGGDVIFELLHRVRRGTPFRKLAEHGLDEPALRVLGFTPDKRRVLVVRERADGRQLLQTLDPVTREFGKPLFSASDHIRSVRHEQERLALVMLEGERPEQSAPAGPWKSHLADLTRSHPGARYDLLAGLEDGRGLWLVESDTRPAAYVLSDGNGGVATVAQSRPEPSRGLAPMRPFRFQARDGLELGGYLTRRGDGPAPAVVLVHGGPWARDRWGFDGEAQFLAALGYAVLQVNFRGSAGLGHELLKAGKRQWGRAMQADLVDAVRHAAAQGWIDPERVCVMGGSYGAYAALLGVLEDPERFRCAIGLAPVTDLADQIEGYRERDHRRAWMEWRTMVGNPAAGRERLLQASPLARAATLERPVLLAHGSEDRAVPLSHSRRFLEAAPEERVRWLLLEGEGHALVHRESRRRYYRAVAEFLEQKLGS